MILTSEHQLSSRTRFSSAKAGFLNALAKDLQDIGIRASAITSGRTLVFRSPSRKPSTDRLTTSLRVIRKNRLRESWTFIDRLQREGVARQFAEGSTLDLDSISPVIELCTTKGQRELFDFCRLMQSVPAQRLLYRRLSFLVRDAGQPTRPLIGVLGLSSMVYSLACRDAFLGWDTDRRKNIKEWGINRCMQLSVCMAVPPYNYLRAGKLLAGLALGSEVAEEFARRYSKPSSPEYLLGVVTSAANGLHSPIFTRIMVKPGGLFRRIGATHGYTALPFREATIDAARSLVLQRDGVCYENRTIRTLKRALNICGLPREFFVTLGIPKGIYWGAPDDGATEALRSGHRTYEPVYPSREAIVQFWKQHVQKAIARPDISAAVRDFEPRTCRATRSRGLWDGI